MGGGWYVLVLTGRRRSVHGMAMDGVRWGGNGTACFSRWTWGFVFVRLQQWCLSVALFQLIEPAVVSVVETSEWDYANE